MNADHVGMGLVDEVLTGIVGSAMTFRSRGRRWGWGRPRAPRSRVFVPVVRTPWLTVAGMCVLALLVFPAAAVARLVLLLGAALADDTLGPFLLIIFGPVALGGILVIVPIILSGLVLVRRTFARDGSTRVEVLCAGLAGATLTMVSLLTSGYLPLLVVLVPSAGLVAIAASPVPWRRLVRVEWSTEPAVVSP